MEASKRYSETSDFPRAVLQLKDAIQVAPKDPEAYYQLGLLYIRLHSYSEAQSVLVKASELDPKSTAAKVELLELASFSPSRSAVQAGEKSAKQLLNTAFLKPDPAASRVLSALALSEWRLGDEENAEAHLREAITTAPTDLKPVMLSVAMKLSKHETKSAETDLISAVRNAPKSPEAALALGRFYLMGEQDAGAEKEIRRALELKPDFGPALTDLGALELRRGDVNSAENSYLRASKLKGPEYEPIHAIFLVRTHQYTNAIPELEALAKRHPGDRLARSRLVAVYLEAHRDSDALKLLNVALNKNSKDVEALLQKSEIDRRTGNVEGARQELAEVVHFRPDMPEAHLALGRVYQDNGDSLLAEQEMAQALRLRPSLLPARLALAQSMIESNRAKTALDLLDGAPQRDHAEVEMMRNWALLQMRDLKNLQRNIERGERLARRPELVLQHALLATEQKNYTLAMSLLNELLSRPNPDPLALRALVRVYALENRWKDVTEQVRTYAQKHRDSAPIQELAGEFLAESNQPDEARAYFLEAKKAEPGNVSLDLQLAKLDLKTGDVTEARSLVSSVLKNKPRNFGAHLLLGAVNERTQHRAEAIQEYRLVADAQPMNQLARNNLAVLLGEEGSLDEAIRYAMQALELAPENHDVQDTAGWLYYRKGMYSTALKYLEKTGRSVGAKTEDKVHLSLAYLMTGDKQRAWNMLTEVGQSDPRSPDFMAAVRLFSEKN